MSKKKKVLIVILIILILIGIGVGIYFAFFHKQNENAEPVQEVKVTNQIENYGYNLDDRDTELFKTTFNKLKDLLEQEEVDKEEYASLVSQLFIIDLYTINNKISKYDIGGVEYMYKDAVESFKSVVMDSIYKTVVNNIDKKREQDLPEVESITVDEIKEGTYTMVDDTSVSSYEVSLSWEYVEDLDYDTSGVVTLIVNDNRIDVVSFEAD